MSDQPLIQTPEYLQNRARQLHDELNRQARYVAMLDTRDRRDWVTLRDQWVRWYGEPPSWIWGATNDTLNDFATKIGAWSVALEQAGAPRSITPRPAATTPAGSGLSDTASVVLWIVIGFVALKLLD